MAKTVDQQHPHAKFEFNSSSCFEVFKILTIYCILTKDIFFLFSRYVYMLNITEKISIPYQISTKHQKMAQP